MKLILGISGFYHDSAAALVRDGEIIAAAQEERFTRRKNDPGFPHQSIGYCLREGRIEARELDAVVFYDKPIRKFSRALETFLAIAPRGAATFVRAMPGWLAEKLNLRATIRAELDLPKTVPIFFTPHHLSHAASAFYPSPFRDAAILTVDGVGEYSTTTIAAGTDSEIQLLEELNFPHSLGLLYSAFTAYCGFRVNSGEYKLMGLAPYGEPKFERAIYENLIDLKTDGSFRLNMEFFDFLAGERMTNRRFENLFGGPTRAPEGPIDTRFIDLARSIQNVTEEIMLRLARHARDVTGKSNLCLAGGVALNCVANGRILREKIFERFWIQPAAGDAGGAGGAALALWHERAAGSRTKARTGRDEMRGSLLGPAYSNEEIEATLKQFQAVYELVPGEDELAARSAQLIAEGKIIGWFQGRMEFGPRALGSRSILGDPRSPAMQSAINLKVKFRESFRPFAPAILEGRLADYFELDTASPYMLLVAPIRPEHRLTCPSHARGLEQLKQPRSTLPAITHVDYSARIQTVGSESNPRFRLLLGKFNDLTGCPVLINTSFNVRGEPIVCTPEDAYRCFLRTEIDFLVIGNFILNRLEQPKHAFIAKLELD
jgi:carbamoyltransferase